MQQCTVFIRNVIFFWWDWFGEIPYEINRNIDEIVSAIQWKIKIQERLKEHANEYISYLSFSLHLVQTKNEKKKKSYTCIKNIWLCC